MCGPAAEWCRDPLRKGKNHCRPKTLRPPTFPNLVPESDGAKEDQTKDHNSKSNTCNSDSEQPAFHYHSEWPCSLGEISDNSKRQNITTRMRIRKQQGRLHNKWQPDCLFNLINLITFLMRLLSWLMRGEPHRSFNFTSAMLLTMSHIVSLKPNWSYTDWMDRL